MLAVITFTRQTRPELLERCKSSVAQALPPGAKHVIIECFKDFEQTRYEAALSEEFVAFVDDDDTIDHRSLKHSMHALHATGAGISGTDELMVDLEGRTLSEFKNAKYYTAIANHPRVMHHLCIFRSAAVPSAALELNERFGFGIDWFLKAGIARTSGAVHIPINGYSWTQHENTLTSQHNELYNTHIHDMAAAITEMWPRADARVPVYRV